MLDLLFYKGESFPCQLLPLIGILYDYISGVQVCCRFDGNTIIEIFNDLIYAEECLP